MERTRTATWISIEDGAAEIYVEPGPKGSCVLAIHSDPFHFEAFLTQGQGEELIEALRRH
jgi:hypothetical protein